MRYYGKWAGQPAGDHENPKRCVAAVKQKFSVKSWQCLGIRGKGPRGLYCARHAYLLKQGSKLTVPRNERANHEA